MLSKRAGRASKRRNRRAQNGEKEAISLLRSYGYSIQGQQVRQQTGMYVDGIWNLVLSCKSCNRGEKGKFAKLPSIKLLERLNKRNEYFCSSHHPLRETIMSQTGNTIEQRKSFLQKCFNEAKGKLIHTWEPIPKDTATF